MGALTFEPLIPLAIWLPQALAAVCALAWYGWTRPATVPRQRWATLITLMGTGPVLVLLLLLNPTWLEPIVPPGGKPLLTVLLDRSASMATPDVEGRSRYEAAAELAWLCQERRADTFEVRLLTFADTATAAEAADLPRQHPEGATTDLAAAIEAGIARDREQKQYLLLLSDGIHHAGGTDRVLAAARLARSLACPISTRTYGGAAAVKDLAIELRSPQELA